jgi:hypothetical protein
MEISRVVSVIGEFEGVDLGHKKREVRLIRIAAALATKPDASFPEATGGDADLAGVYRFVNNKHVTAQDVLKPHVAHTVERVSASREAVVVVAHDTTGLEFAGSGRKGLGRMLRSERGFYGHFSLAVKPDEQREPLGILSFIPVVRNEEHEQQTTTAMQRNPDKEYLRWIQGIEQSEKQLTGVKRIIHVADRESDSYEIISKLLSKECGFVLRLKFNRNVVADEQLAKLYDILQQARGLAEREVPLQFRQEHKSPATRKLHPPRDARLATLVFGAKRVRLIRPVALSRKDYPDFLDVHVVRVWEPNPPLGEDPIEWKLVTAEPVDSPEQILRVVDYYRCRWRIEEFNKALKTGCKAEARQLIELDALLNALAILIPIAWAILHLRTLANSAEPPPASAVLTDTQTKVLNAHPKTKKLFRTDRPATCRDALHAVAALGGHLKRNGAPGWLTILRGYKTLTDLVLGWELRDV